MVRGNHMAFLALKTSVNCMYSEATWMEACARGLSIVVMLASNGCTVQVEAQVGDVTRNSSA